MDNYWMSFVIINNNKYIIMYPCQINVYTFYFYPIPMSNVFLYTILSIRNLMYIYSGFISD